jgi:pilus assembly protein CpaE
VLQASDEILVVLQPSLLSVHDAVRLKTVLIRELEIPEARITGVVNRYSRNGTLDIGDIRRALDDDDLVLIPNHYKLVAESLDMGVPVVDQAPNSPVAKALVGLQGRVMGGRMPDARGFLAKTVFRLRG